MIVAGAVHITFVSRCLQSKTPFARKRWSMRPSVHDVSDDATSSSDDDDDEVEEEEEDEEAEWDAMKTPAATIQRRRVLVDSEDEDEGAGVDTRLVFEGKEDKATLESDSAPHSEHEAEAEFAPISPEGPVTPLYHPRTSTTDAMSSYHTPTPQEEEDEDAAPPSPIATVCAAHKATVAAAGFVCTQCRCDLPPDRISVYNTALQEGMAERKGDPTFALTRLMDAVSVCSDDVRLHKAIVAMSAKVMGKGV